MVQFEEEPTFTIKAVPRVVSITGAVVAALSVCAGSVLVALVCSFLALITLNAGVCVPPHITFLTLTAVGAHRVYTLGVGLTVVAIMSAHHLALVFVCKVSAAANDHLYCCAPHL